MRTLNDFREMVLCDFEYHQKGPQPGMPVPVCACALELRSGREFRIWQDQLAERVPPWAHGRETILVCYNACAELGCYLQLGWPLPPFILDLLIEHRQLANGVLAKHDRRDLLSAMRFYGLSGIEAMEKEDWQTLILTGGPYTPEQRDGILDYCWSDIDALRVLLPAMLPKMPRDLDRALFRGRYTIPATFSMQTGIPVDTAAWNLILDQREVIKREVAAGCPCYEGTTFKLDRFAEFLASRDLLGSWPRTETNRLSIDDDSFRKCADHPEVESLRQIRQVIDQLSKPSFLVSGGRNYYSILPFQALTSRNSTKECIFQAPSWMRGLIQPTPGQALAYIDFEQEEFFLAGVLSDDPAIRQAYAGGDPYIGFGVMAGTIPVGATKHTHPTERDVCKTLMIALLYGMAAPALALRLGVSLNRAEDLLATVRHIYYKLWKWSNQQVQRARWTRQIETTFGWRLAVDYRTKRGTLRNFKVQGCGAEILRLAHLFLWEAGIRVCVPVHDAFLIDCAETDLDDVVLEARNRMERASEIVLQGYRIRTEAMLFRHPARFIEPCGESMWNHVLTIAKRLNSDNYVGRSIYRSLTSPYSFGAHCRPAGGRS